MNKKRWRWLQPQEAKAEFANQNPNLRWLQPQEAKAVFASLIPSRKRRKAQTNQQKNGELNIVRRYFFLSNSSNKIFNNILNFKNRFTNKKGLPSAATLSDHPMPFRTKTIRTVPIRRPPLCEWILTIPQTKNSRVGLIDYLIVNYKLANNTENVKQNKKTLLKSVWMKKYNKKLILD